MSRKIYNLPKLEVFTEVDFKRKLNIDSLYVNFNFPNRTTWKLLTGKLLSHLFKTLACPMQALFHHPVFQL
jgi:hypothetical protein